MNTPRLEELLQSFYDISGMDVALVNHKNRIIARRYSGAGFCSALHNSAKCLETCVDSDACQICRARETGELVVYKCPFGIYEALMPIKKNEEVVAYLFLGMGIEDAPGSEAEPLARALDVSPNLDKDALQRGIADLPHNSKEKIEAYASLLPVLAEYIEANNILSDSEMTIGQHVKTYVKNNLSHKITLTDIAWKLHCSTVTVTEHFKKEFGMTVMEYVMQKRIQKAEQLLKNSDLSIREISEACGFPNVEYFSRSFKGARGISPSTWKKINTESSHHKKKRRRSAELTSPVRMTEEKRAKNSHNSGISERQSANHTAEENEEFKIIGSHEDW